MTKDELQAKRAVALSELKDIEVALCLDEHYIDIIEKENAKLTKAKEIIKEFVSWANWEGANCPNFKDIQSKAEQFLKEIEK